MRALWGNDCLSKEEVKSIIPDINASYNIDLDPNNEVIWEGFKDLNLDSE